MGECLYNFDYMYERSDNIKVSILSDILSSNERDIYAFVVPSLVKCVMENLLTRALRVTPS